MTSWVDVTSPSTINIGSFLMFICFVTHGIRKPRSM
jgi:hypothetical protein